MKSSERVDEIVVGLSSDRDSWGEVEVVVEASGGAVLIWRTKEV